MSAVQHQEVRMLQPLFVVVCYNNYIRMNEIYRGLLNSAARADHH
jgi:hypothetical protein